jgi:hypothetical protein
LGCRGSTPSNDGPMQRPAPESRAPGWLPAAGMSKSARHWGGRAVGEDTSGCWGTHPRDRARPGPLARGAVVAHVRHGPERSDRRGGRNARLGRAPHVGRALRVRAGRRDLPLARTTTRTLAWRPWSSREGRGSREVGVHRSCREGPDWPALSRPSPDALSFLCVPSGPTVAPALLGQLAFLRSPSLSCLASPLCPSRAWGRVRRRRQKRSDPTPSTAGLQAYCVRY